VPIFFRRLVAVVSRCDLKRAVPAPTCVEFLGLADNTHPGTDFVRDSYRFQALGGDPFINVFTDSVGNPVHGLQFANAGMRVKLPAPAATVEVTIGVFSSPDVQIRAFSSTGVLVDSATVAADNNLHTITLAGAQSITRLRFTGGGGEGVINNICIP